MEFPGARDLVTALAGGSGYEQTAYNREFARLTAAKSAAANMDKKVAEAAMAETENTQFQDLGRFFDPRQTAVMQSGTGADLSALMTAEGTEQKNDMRGNLMEMIDGMVKSDAPQNDIFNAIASAISGQTLTAPELGAQAQSGADLDLTQRKIQETIAGIGSENALTVKRGAETSNIGAGGGVNLESLGTLEQGLLYANPETIPIERDAPGLFTGDITENIPFTDPRAQQKWAGMTKDQRNTMMRDFAPEFTSWRLALMMTEPSVAQDSQQAIARFLEEKGLAGTTTNTTTGEKSTTDQATRNERLIYNPATGGFTKANAQ
jgi:hypothetical protein